IRCVPLKRHAPLHSYRCSANRRTLGGVENRILFGDCRQHLATLASESVDLVLTDPPYNTGHTAGSSRLRHFFDDALPIPEYRELARTVSAELFRVLKNDRAAYVFINWKSLGVWLDALAGSGFRLKN